MSAVDISTGRLILGYTLLLIPLGLILWLRIPILGQTAIAVIRMTVQLLFVGLYLQVVFRTDQVWLTALWLLVMLVVADFSVLKGSTLRPRAFAPAFLCALLAGTLLPMVFLVGIVLGRPDVMEARFAIPIGGMILGNCLRTDIIGLRSFYHSLRDEEKLYLGHLAQGAQRHEAIRPYLRHACESALAPTIATMTTIGLVSLPGMMTGVILGGADPATAVKYQIMIMIAIFTGTAITLVLAIQLSLLRSFNAQGILRKDIFS